MDLNSGLLRKASFVDLSSAHAADVKTCWNRVGTCGVPQLESRLDDLDQRPCVSQRNNFIESAPIPANYGRTFCARMIETIPMEDLR